MTTSTSRKALNASFLRSLPMTAAALGDKFGIKVCVGGTDCSTNGAVIRLPAASSCVSENELLGYLTHEAAHVRLTDFEAERATGAGNRLRHELINAMEDVRIENEFQKIYPGARLLLDACHEQSVEEICRNHECLQQSAGALLALYALARGHVIWTKLDYVEPLLEILEALMTTQFGAALKSAIDAVLGELPDAKSTVDVIGLADRILNLLKSQAQRSPKPQSEAHSDESAAQSAKPHESAQKAKSCDQTGERKEAAASQDQSEAQHAKACSEALASEADAFDRRMDVSRRYGERIATLNRKEIAEGLNFPEINMSELSKEVRNAGSLRPFNPLKREKTRKEALGDERILRALNDSQAARRALLGLVQAKARRERWTARSGRRLSAPNAARLAVWNTRVFERSMHVKAVDTALHVLVDLSGSMTGDKEQIAVRASLALMAALMSIPHVNPALSVFNGSKCFSAIVPHGARSLARFAGRIGALRASSSTPLAEALVGAALSLSGTKEARKAVLVLTDGAPNSFSETETVVEALRRNGISVYGLGIGVPFNMKLFDVRAHIQTIEELEPALFEIAKAVAFEANGAA